MEEKKYTFDEVVEEFNITDRDGELAENEWSHADVVDIVKLGAVILRLEEEVAKLKKKRK